MANYSAVPRKLKEAGLKLRYLYGQHSESSLPRRRHGSKQFIQDDSVAANRMAEDIT